MLVGASYLKSLVRTVRPDLCLLVAALVLMCGLCSAAEGAGARTPADSRVVEPVAASDGNHLWFFESASVGDSRRVLVLHNGPFHAPSEAWQASLTEDLPEAVLAVDARLFCFFRGRRSPDGGFFNRPVSTLRAESWDRSARKWDYNPSPRARTVADLPGAGVICGVVADGRDPLVLLAPFRPATDPDGRPAEEAADRPSLKRLRLGQWQDVDLPEDARARAGFYLLPGTRPILLTATDEASECIAWTLEEDDSWTSQPSAIDLDRIAGAALHDGQTFIAMHDAASRRTDVVLLRHGRTYPIVQAVSTGRDLTLVSLRGELALVEATADRGGVRLRAIDVAAGTMGEVTELRRRLRPALEDFSLLILIGALLVAMLLMFLFRPGDPSRVTVQMPRGMQVAEPRRRFVALLIDLLPAAILSSLILRIPLLDVFSLSRLPMRAQHLEDMAPMLLMLVICAAHSTLCELLWGRTLGKVMMDCSVRGIDGRAAPPLAILVRNAMKLIALLVPVLFLFVYLNQYRQSLGDLTARTMVLTTTEDQAPPEAPSDDER